MSTSVAATPGVGLVGATAIGTGPLTPARKSDAAVAPARVPASQPAILPAAVILPRGAAWLNPAPVGAQEPPASSAAPVPAANATSLLA